MRTKIIIIIAIVVVVAIGWLLYRGSTVSYVATIDDQVTALESDLTDLQAAVQSGKLSPDAAAQAQERIAKRLSNINAAIESGKGVALTASQQEQLLLGLQHLRSILSKYQDTLAAVDEKVLELPEAKRPQLNPIPGHGGSHSLVNAITATVNTVESHVEDVISDYVLSEQATSTNSTSTEISTGSATSSENMEHATNTGAARSSSTESSAMETNTEPAQTTDSSGTKTTASSTNSSEATTSADQPTAY